MRDDKSRETVSYEWFKKDKNAMPRALRAHFLPFLLVLLLLRSCP